MQFFLKTTFFLLFLNFKVSYSQTQTNTLDTALQDSLIHLGFTMYNEPNEALRLSANYTFIKTLVQLLKSPNSFNRSLDSLNMIAIKLSPDRSFRLFSWHLKLDDGSYRYYGAIQLNTPDGSLNLKPLVDKSPTLEKPENTIGDNNQWYGAQYYDIIPLDGLPDHYILLGWRGSTPEVSEKVIEILKLTPQHISFGMALFKGGAVDKQITRVIYRYNAQVSMLLKYEKPNQQIIMDHLAPSDPAYVGEFKYYGPDMSYDVWKIKKDHLQLLEDLPLKNPQ